MSVRGIEPSYFAGMPTTQRDPRAGHVGEGYAAMPGQALTEVANRDERKRESDQSNAFRAREQSHREEQDRSSAARDDKRLAMYQQGEDRRQTQQTFENDRLKSADTMKLVQAMQAAINDGEDGIAEAIAAELSNRGFNAKRTGQAPAGVPGPGGPGAPPPPAAPHPMSPQDSATSKQLDQAEQSIVPKLTGRPADAPVLQQPGAQGRSSQDAALSGQLDDIEQRYIGGLRDPNQPRSLLPGSAMRAPYGMTPGVRAVLPGINDMSATAWNKPPEPDKIDLDAPIANPPQPVPPMAAEPAGWELTDPHGNVVHLRSDAHKQRDADQVKALGGALLNHATSEEEKAVAQRAIDWGMAQVGQADIGDIRKEMTHYWDNGTGGILKMDLQQLRSKANRGGKGGVPNAVGENGMPLPTTKFGHALDKDLNDRVSQVIQHERAGGKYAALSEHENTLGQMDEALNSGNSMAERVAVQQQLLALTGKASRESEQAAITGAAGKWEELKNKLSLWTSSDPNLSRAYVAKFKGMIAAQRSAIQKQKEQLAIQAATRMREQASGYPEDVAGHAADIVYGSMSGHFRGGSYTPPAAAPAAAPADSGPPGDNSDLYAP